MAVGFNLAFKGLIFILFNYDRRSLIYNTIYNTIHERRGLTNDGLEMLQKEAGVVGITEVLSSDFFLEGLRIITNSLSRDGRVPERFSNTRSPEFMYRVLLLLLLARCEHSFIALHTHTHTYIYIYIFLSFFDHRLSVCPPVGENINSFFVYCVPSNFTHFLFRSLYFPLLSYSLRIFQRNSKGVPSIFTHFLFRSLYFLFLTYSLSIFQRNWKCVWLNLLNVCSVIRFTTLYAIMCVLLLSVNIWKHQFHICAIC
jgi:hypothetical protein